MNGRQIFEFTGPDGFELSITAPQLYFDVAEKWNIGFYFLEHHISYIKESYYTSVYLFFIAIQVAEI